MNEDTKEPEAKAEASEIDELKKNIGLLEYRIKDRAYWNIFRKYFGALLATILALILAKPDAAKDITIKGLKLSDVIIFYFTVGVLGLVFHEYKNATEELLEEKGGDYSITIRKIVFVYLLIGISICFMLLQNILS